MSYKLLIMCLVFLLIFSFSLLPIVLADEPEETPSTSPKAVGERLDKEIDGYINQLLNDNPVIVERARNELLELGHRAVPQLIKALSHEKHVLRYMACEILAELRDKRALPNLLKLLEDKEEVGMSIGSIAVRALGRLGDASAIPSLTKALESTDVDLRYEAIRALGTLRAYDSIPEISRLISDTARTFFGYEIRCGVIESLGRLKARTQMKELIDLLTIKVVEPATERPAVAYIIEALERITGETQGSIPLGIGSKLDELTKKWQDWWTKHKSEYSKPEKPMEELEKPKEKIEEPQEKSEAPEKKQEESKSPAAEEPAKSSSQNEDVGTEKPEKDKK